MYKKKQKVIIEKKIGKKKIKRKMKKKQEVK